MQGIELFHSATCFQGAELQVKKRHKNCGWWGENFRLHFSIMEQRLFMLSHPGVLFVWVYSFKYKTPGKTKLCREIAFILKGVKLFLKPPKGIGENNHMKNESPVFVMKTFLPLSYVVICSYLYHTCVWFLFLWRIQKAFLRDCSVFYDANDWFSVNEAPLAFSGSHYLVSPFPTGCYACSSLEIRRTEYGLLYITRMVKRNDFPTVSSC